MHAIKFFAVVVAVYFGGSWAWRALLGGDAGAKCIKSHDCKGLMSRCHRPGAYCSPSCEDGSDCPDGWSCSETGQSGNTHCVRPR